MTADEARARMNLPSMGGDAEQLVTPLNVLVGGQASPRDSAPKGRGAESVERGAKAAGEVDPTQPELRAQFRKRWVSLMVRTFERQRLEVMSTLKAKALPDLSVLWDQERWNGELSVDVFQLSVVTSDTLRGSYRSRSARIRRGPDAGLSWENSRIAAEHSNAVTQSQIEELRAEGSARGDQTRL
jgi:hypothetical protein